MALSAFTPAYGTDELVSVDEAVLILKDTPHPVSKSTVKRWIQRYEIRRARIKGKVYVSFSDVLEAQRDDFEEKRQGS